MSFMNMRCFMKIFYRMFIVAIMFMTAIVTNNNKVVEAAEFENGLLGVFFSSDEDTALEWYYSKDGVHMQEFFRSPDMEGRDPSLQYYNGKYYLCLVMPSDVEDTFYIAESTDLKNWTKKSYTVTDKHLTWKCHFLWAPDLFIDKDGSAYVYFSKVDENGRFSIYVSSNENIETGDFTEAKRMELPVPTDDTIDAQVRNINGTYYMIVKNEHKYIDGGNKSPFLLKSDNPVDNFKLVEDWPLRAIRGYEGYSFLENNGKIYMYADRYVHRFDGTGDANFTVWTSDDIEKGPYKAEYIYAYGRSLRHGAVIKVEDAQQKAGLETAGIVTPVEDENWNKQEIKEVPLTDYTRDEVKNISEFAPGTNVVYVIPGGRKITIDKIVNAYGVEYVDFKFKTNSSALTINGNRITKKDADESGIYRLTL